MSQIYTVQLERAQMPTAQVRTLVHELDQELSAHYPPEQQHGLALDEIFRPHIRFFIAFMEGSAVGCGGVALFSDFGEIKRMYVRSASRGQGIADAIITRLETEASDAGLTALRLETGTQQIAAIRFYRRHGFELCKAFEPYASMPTYAVANSVFLEKQLFAG
jgi:putative acetyltransferase